LAKGITFGATNKIFGGLFIIPLFYNYNRSKKMGKKLDETKIPFFRRRGFPRLSNSAGLNFTFLSAL
jgi:hypothetical protein